MCELFIDGEQFYPAILDAISKARSHILIEVYLVESGEVMDAFINSLVKQARKGITVQLLFDDYGSNKLSLFDRGRLINSGAELVFYNPIKYVRWTQNLHRDHRKLFIIDGTIAFTGGAGITDSFIGDSAWREVMIRTQGRVVTDWQQLFIDNLQTISPDIQTPSPLKPLKIWPDNKSGDVRTRVVYSNGGTRIELKRSLLKRIRHSKKKVLSDKESLIKPKVLSKPKSHSKPKIWLATAYFIPSRKIRRALSKAARQGKDVRLLLPGEITDHPAIVYASQRYYARLLRHGVRIYEYQGRFMHTKVALVDDWSSIGSSNMDRWNLLWNLEANQEVKDPGFANEVKMMLLNDFMHSKEIRYEKWKNRSRFQRFLEWFWGKVDLWLTKERA